jgi:cobaltochelatase CobN
MQVRLALLAESFAAAPPAVILNATGFAVSAGPGAEGSNPLRASDCPVLQVVFSGSSEEAWRADAQGLGPRDLAMNVVLPELDGRIMTRAVSFKADRERHGPTECRIVTYRPVPTASPSLPTLPPTGRLARTPQPERRIAIVLANYPNRDGRIGNGVGYDTPASTLAILQALAEAGYRVDAIPASPNAVIEALAGRPDERRATAGRRHPAAWRILRFFAQLPQATQDAVTERWGRRTATRMSATAPSIFRCTITARSSPPSSRPGATISIPRRPITIRPCRRRTAIWPSISGCVEVFGAHAVIHNGKHGNLEWLPGKANALSAGCFPEAASAPCPSFIPSSSTIPAKAARPSGALPP